MKTFDEADTVARQIVKPCEDCPFRRTAVAGWLADQTPADYCQMAHSDDLIQCHTKKLADGDHVQCAGAAIYRANVSKRCAAPNIALPQDKEAVFATPIEFIEHHSRKKLTPSKIRKLMLAAFQRRIRILLTKPLPRRTDCKSARCKPDSGTGRHLESAMTKKRDRKKSAERQHSLMEKQGGVDGIGWRPKRRPVVKGKNKFKVKS